MSRKVPAGLALPHLDRWDVRRQPSALANGGSDVLDAVCQQHREGDGGKIEQLHSHVGRRPQRATVGLLPLTVASW
jgi:hypothetical protein